VYAVSGYVVVDSVCNSNDMRLVVMKDKMMSVILDCSSASQELRLHVVPAEVMTLASQPLSPRGASKDL